MGKLLTLYFKRLRKDTGSKVRYLLVAEPHSKELVGLPHYHCLIHELAGRVSYRQVCDQWPYGHVHAKLVEQGADHAANYVAKYIAKLAVTRVRASLGYGKAP